MGFRLFVQLWGSLGVTEVDGVFQFIFLSVRGCGDGYIFLLYTCGCKHGEKCLGYRLWLRIKLRTIIPSFRKNIGVVSIFFVIRIVAEVYGERHHNFGVP